jgi:hypothetical protein
MNAVKDHRYVKEIQNSVKEMPRSFVIDCSEEADPSKHQKKGDKGSHQKQFDTKHTTKSQSKNVASALLAKSLKRISNQEIAAEKKKTKSEHGTPPLPKQNLTKVPPILSKKHANETTDNNSETAPQQMSSENVSQIRDTASKSKSGGIEAVSSHPLSESKTSSVPSNAITPVIIPSPEKSALQNSGLGQSGTAQTLTTPTFVNPVSSSRVSHNKKKKSKTVEGNKVPAKPEGQLGTSPNMNLMFVGAPNAGRYCLIQHPTDQKSLQLVANPLFDPKQITNSSPAQPGVVLIPSSQTSLSAPYTGTTTTPTSTLRRILPAAPPPTQNKVPDTPQKDTASPEETPAVSSPAESSVSTSAPPTSLPKVFILAAPNSMSTDLKANRSGFIVPGSSSPTSTVTQTGVTSKAPSVDAVTSDIRKTEGSLASQLLLSFIKNELSSLQPAKEDKVSNITDDRISNIKEEVQDDPLPNSKNTEKSVVPAKPEEKSKSETKNSFVKIGNALYNFVVMDGKQCLVPISQPLSGPAGIGVPIVPQTKEFMKAANISTQEKRKHEEGKVNNITDTRLLFSRMNGMEVILIFHPI